MIARTGATVGKTLLYREKDGSAVYAGYLIRFRLNSQILLPEFLEQFSRSNEYKRWIKKTAQVGAQPNINAGEYSKLAVPVPPISEQKNLISILQIFDREIDLLHKKLGIIQKQKTWLTQKLLLGQIRFST